MTTPAAPDKPDRRLARLLPIVGWLPGYSRAWLRSDLMAGVTVGAFAVPENLAYAGLADELGLGGAHAAIPEAIAAWKSHPAARREESVVA